MRTAALSSLLPWRALPRPLDPAAIFGREAPLELEIGFGNAEWLARCAEDRPAHDFLGIENQWPSVKRALQRLSSRAIPNARLVLCDARVAVQRLLLPRSLHAITALFPCPWPKDRHEKHRLFDAPFLRLMNSRLVDGGSALVVTDHEPLVEWMLARVAHSGFEARCERVPPRYLTKYERKWQGQGQQEFFEIHLDKRTHDDVPCPEDATLQAHRLDRFDPARFSPAPVDEGDLHIQVKELLYDPEAAKALVQVVVVEGPLNQNFWIEVGRRGDHWRVQPARGCGVVPTPGVQRALDLVRDGAA